MDKTDITTLPCGCVMYNLGNKLVYEPCSLTCEVYAYFLEEAERQNKEPRTFYLT
jgi:hypothetical protein